MFKTIVSVLVSVLTAGIFPAVFFVEVSGYQSYLVTRIMD